MPVPRPLDHPGSSTTDLTREPWVLASDALPASDGDAGEAGALGCGTTGKSKAAASAGGWRRLALYALYAIVLWAMLLVHRRSAALAASAAGAGLPVREGVRVSRLGGSLLRDSL